jgi:hypothetical protein
LFEPLHGVLVRGKWGGRAIKECVAQLFHCGLDLLGKVVTHHIVLGTDKERAQLRAMELFPAADLRQKKDHGRAEALLLAYYHRQMNAGTRRCLDMGKN